MHTKVEITPLLSLISDAGTNTYSVQPVFQIFEVRIFIRSRKENRVPKYVTWCCSHPYSRTCDI